MGLSTASTLAWIWGLLMVFGGVALGFPALSMGHSLVLPVILFVLGSALCYGGYGLRRKRRAASILAVGVSALTVIFHLFMHVGPGPVGIIVNLAIIVLVLVNWKHLE